MKNLFLIIISIFCFALIVHAKGKTSKATLKVMGNCGDCRERIEEACYTVKGVKSAKWDKKLKVLNLVFNQDKCTLQDISNAINKAGHDTELGKASDETYKSLPSCCAYREGKCVHDH